MIENILNTFIYFKSIGIEYTGDRVDKKWGENKKTFPFFSNFIALSLF